MVKENCSIWTTINYMMVNSKMIPKKGMVFHSKITKKYTKETSKMIDMMVKELYYIPMEIHNMKVI